MKKILIVILTLAFSYASYAQTAVIGKQDRKTSRMKQMRTDTDQSMDCLSEAELYNTVGLATEAEKFAIEMLGIEVSPEEENDYGDRAYEQMKTSGDYKFITSGAQLTALKKMMNNLLSNRVEKSGLTYTMHLIDDKMVNAFTLGGHVYMTTGIIKFADSESAIAAIIGHEIGHNEKGHINLIMKKMKVANALFDGAGNIGVSMQKMLFPFFNQVNEIEVDYYGIDMCVAAGYDPVKGVELWDKMAAKENKGDVLDSFSRSHPYSSDRASCIRNYISVNY